MVAPLKYSFLSLRKTTTRHTKKKTKKKKNQRTGIVSDRLFARHHFSYCHVHLELLTYLLSYCHVTTVTLLSRSISVTERFTGLLLTKFVEFRVTQIMFCGFHGMVPPTLTVRYHVCTLNQTTTWNWDSVWSVFWQPYYELLYQWDPQQHKIHVCWSSLSFTARIIREEHTWMFFLKARDWHGSEVTLLLFMFLLVALMGQSRGWRHVHRSGHS